ncbi:MAG: MCE family protein [Planctomycetota bacterium]|nr:MAG: MCE family protein [Planctomycetota bacterium]
MNDALTNPDLNTLPRATVGRRKSLSWWWVLPLFAFILVGWVLWLSFARAGLSVVVVFPQGHGLAVGSDLRHRGIQVGVVEGIGLSEDTQGVEVRLRLFRSAQHLAREGSLFWIVRPQLSTAGVMGLDTVIGARYLAVIPGEGPPLRHFHGLDMAPVLADLQPGGLEILLEADRQGSLQPGAPVLYRQVRVGRVLSVGLAPDSSAVTVRAYIEPAYRNLVRHNSRFWNASGISIDIGLGASIEVESLASLLIGGIAFATPTQAGNEVVAGHRFPLAPRGEDHWRSWRPSLLVGEPLAEHLYPLPILQRSELHWQQTSWARRREHSRRGWVLVVEAGLLGCANSLVPAAAAEHPATLEIAGKSFPLHADPIVITDGLALLPLASGIRPWPQQRLRVPNDPENIILVADPSLPPVLVSSARMEPDSAGAWVLERGLIKDHDWHGAAAISLADGAVVAILDSSGWRPRLLPLRRNLLED